MARWPIGLLNRAADARIWTSSASAIFDVTKYSSESENCHSDALRALARALAPYLRQELNLDGHGRADGWMSHRDTPSPRLTMAACRSGKIPGAKKLGRKWVFREESWQVFLEVQAAPLDTVGARPPAPTANLADDELMAEVRSELGLVPCNRVTTTFRR